MCFAPFASFVALLPLRSAASLAPVQIHSQQFAAQPGQQVPGGFAARGKVRGPVAVWLLAIITFGLHSIYFQGQLNRVWDGR